MEVRYRKEFKESYLILDAGEKGDDYTSRILTENRIPGLLSVSARSLDEEVEYYYEISGKQSLKKLLEKRQIGCEEMQSLLYGIGQTLENMEEYLLDAERVLLEPEFLYATSDLKEIFLCCHPAYEADLLEGFRGLTRYFLNKIDHMEKNSVEMAYGLFQVANQESFSLEDLLEVLRQYQAEKPESEMEAAAASEPSRSHAEGEKESNGEEEGLPEHLQEPQRGFPMYLALPLGGIPVVVLLWMQGLLGESQARVAGLVLLALTALCLGLGFLRSSRKEKEQTLWGKLHRESKDAPRRSLSHFPKGGEETTPLDGVYLHLPRARLLLSQNSLRYETITMKTMPVTIGKLEEACDEVVDHPAISRLHARVEEREDGFYLTDLSSTNGTWLNGNRLEPNRPYLLREGDEVMLADLRYIFQ